MSTSNLSPQEQTQKETYEKGIARARKMQMDPPHTVHTIERTTKKCWESAREWLEAMKSEGRDEEVKQSSVSPYDFLKRTQQHSLISSKAIVLNMAANVSRRLLFIGVSRQ